MVRHRLILLFVLILKLFVVINCLRSEAPTIVVNNYRNCADEEQIATHLNLNLTKIDFNKYAANGEFIFEEFLNGPIEVNKVFKLFSIKIFLNLCFHIIAQDHWKTM